MTRLRSLIKEVLTVQPKEDCNCGCGGCDKKAPIITEGRIKKAISEGLTYHVENKIPLHESVYRIGSEKHFALINEARKLWTRGLINVSEDDQAILETHLGNFGMYEGEKVPLDMPMVNEGFKDYLGYSDHSEEAVDWPKELTSRYSNEYRFELEKVTPTYKDKPGRAKYRVIDIESGELKGTPVFGTPESLMAYADDLIKPQGGTQSSNFGESLNEKVLSENQLDKIEDWKFQNGWGFIEDYRRENEVGINKKIAFLVYNSGDQKDLSPGQSLNVKSLDNLTPKIDQQLVNQLKADYLPSARKITKDMIKQAGVDMVIVVNRKVNDNTIINEAKKKTKSKKKDPPLNKPKRGGSKAYYVYVRDPKTKKIKKVSFGSGGLRAKIKNKEARNAFAARHNCKNKKDRTKAGYWSCNLPRYAEQLGLGSKMNTFW